MSSTGLIVGLGLFGAYVLLRSRASSTPAPAPSSGDACDAIPDADARATCKAALGLAGSAGDLLNAIGNLNNETNDAAQREAQWDADNARLNGATAIPASVLVPGENDFGVNPIGGKTLQYANGCTPFGGSPGFSKCASGTHDMRRHVIDGRYAASQEGSLPAQPSSAALAAARSVDGDYNYGFKPISWSKLLSGSAVPLQQDPATRGPMTGNSWYVKGQKVTCPAGQAPALWDANGNALPNVNGTPACVPNGRASTVQTSYGSTSTTHTSSTGCNPPGAGFTWDPTIGANGAWRRQTVAERASATPVQLPPGCGTPVGSGTSSPAAARLLGTPISSSSFTGGPKT